MTRHAVPTAPERGPGRWEVGVAHLVPLLVLPSSLWRIPVVFGFSMGMVENGAPATVAGWHAVGVLGLSVVTEALALLSLGLVRPWGTVVPGRVPAIGVRRIPPLVAVGPAVLGGLALSAVWAYATLNLLVFGYADFANGWWKALLIGAYLPNNLWGPLLIVLAVAYHRRRRSPVVTGGPRRRPSPPPRCGSRPAACAAARRSAA
jgi:hypothetical protein